MLNFTLQMQIPLPSDPPAIPDALERACFDYHKSIKRVSVQVYRQGWTKFNGFAPKKSGFDVTPDETPEDFATAIMLCVNHHYETTPTPGKAYRVRFYVFESATKVTDRYCAVPMPGDENPGLPSDGGNSFAAAAMRDIVDMSHQQMGRLFEANLQMTDRLISISGQAQPWFDAIAQMLGYFTAGLDSRWESLNARAEATYSTRVAELKAANQQQLIQAVQPAFEVAALQVAQKLGLPVNRSLPAANGAPSPRTPKPEPASSEPLPSGARPRLLQHARALLQSFESGQWWKLFDNLSPGQRDAMRQLDAAASDDEVARSIVELHRSLREDLPRAMTLQKILSPEQRQALASLGTLAELHLSPSPAGSDPEPGT